MLGPGWWESVVVGSGGEETQGKDSGQERHGSSAPQGAEGGLERGHVHQAEGEG